MVHHTKNTNSDSANNASSKISPMLRHLFPKPSLNSLAHCAQPVIQPQPRRALFASMMLAGSVALLNVSGCSWLPKTAQPTPPTPSVHARPDDGAPLIRDQSQWVPTNWQALPGWQSDTMGEAWPSLWRSCQRPTSEWKILCQEVNRLGKDWGARAGDAMVRQWMQVKLQPWRVESMTGDDTGLLTGYVEPLVRARRRSDAQFQTPLHAAPLDLASRKPYYTRAELDDLPAGRAALAGRELVYVADPLDALLVQVQGSTRVSVLDDIGPDGQPRLIRLAFAGHNSQPYASVAGWLVKQGEMSLNQASWQSIKAWAVRNPNRVKEMLHANPRVVFFQEQALRDPSEGPNGAQGVPLTPGRSIAVDRKSIPYGTPVWLDSPGAHPLQRLVVAQDTGGAIIGAVRADYFWGWGDEALAFAGTTKQPLRLWALLPKR